MTSSSGRPAEAGSPIDAYLDELFLRLPRRPARMRHVLGEVEGHLRDSAARASAEGYEDHEAERQAVLRFGDVEQFAASIVPRPGLRRIAADLLRAAWALTGVALVAVGISGVVVAVMNSLAGPSFVGGSEASAVGATNCSHLMQVQATAGTCARAAVLETAHDAVVLRLLAGLLGVVLLLTFALTRRRRPEPALPASFAPTVAVCCFGGAAAALLAAAAGHVHVGDQPAGPGFFLSGGAVAAVLAVGFAAVLLQRLRRPALPETS